MQTVTVYIDESIDRVCTAHVDCKFIGKLPGPECDSRYLYGVGACVFESEADRLGMAERLHRTRQRILARNSVAGARPMKKFAKHGWHATDDPPEFANPLLEEVDLSAPFKGHVRYKKTTEPVLLPDALHMQLCTSLLGVLFRRYANVDSIHIVFEQGGWDAQSCAEMVTRAGGASKVSIELQQKGSDLLALADYLLFATIKYAGQIAVVCHEEGCRVPHVVPTANMLKFDSDGVPLAFGHVSKDVRWHKMYFAFARNMSSVVQLG